MRIRKGAKHSTMKNYQAGQRLMHNYYGEVEYLREDLDAGYCVVKLVSGVEAVVTNTFLKPHQATLAKTPA